MVWREEKKIRLNLNWKFIWAEEISVKKGKKKWHYMCMHANIVEFRSFLFSLNEYGYIRLKLHMSNTNKQIHSHTKMETQWHKGVTTFAKYMHFERYAIDETISHILIFLGSISLHTFKMIKLSYFRYLVLYLTLSPSHSLPLATFPFTIIL